ncbi:hypothetical protein [Psychrobacter sp. JCM 18901]
MSAITIALAVRQNAFPLALLALSGGFFCTDFDQRRYWQLGHLI